MASLREHPATAVVTTYDLTFAGADLSHRRPARLS